MNAGSIVNTIFNVEQFIAAPTGAERDAIVLVTAPAGPPIHPLASAPLKVIPAGILSVISMFAASRVP